MIKSYCEILIFPEGLPEVPQKHLLSTWSIKNIFMAFANIFYFRFNQFVWSATALFSVHITHKHIFFTDMHEYCVFQRKYFVLKIYFISASKKRNLYYTIKGKFRFIHKGSTDVKNFQDHCSGLSVSLNKEWVLIRKSFNRHIGSLNEFNIRRLIVLKNQKTS